MYIDLYVKYLLFLLDFNNFSFLDMFAKDTQVSNFIKIHPMETKLYHADGWTDVSKLIITFRNFVNRPKNEAKWNMYEQWV
jgi:hypothetical protein